MLKQLAIAVAQEVGQLRCDLDLVQVQQVACFCLFLFVFFLMTFTLHNTF